MGSEGLRVGQSSTSRLEGNMLLLHLFSLACLFGVGKGSYHDKVGISPCGIPYPRLEPDSSEMWKLERTKLVLLRERVQNLLLDLKGVRKNLMELGLEPHTWIPDGSKFNEINDFKSGLAEVNRQLKFFSLAFDILHPLYESLFLSKCVTVLQNFHSIYRNHSMLICETDEAMRIVYALPVLDYPTLDFTVPSDWAQINAADCTENTVLSYVLHKKYRHFLMRFHKWLGKYTERNNYIQ